MNVAVSERERADLANLGRTGTEGDRERALALATAFRRSGQEAADTNGHRRLATIRGCGERRSCLRNDRHSGAKMLVANTFAAAPNVHRLGNNDLHVVAVKVRHHE